LTIDPAKSTTPFASVNSVSYFKDKEDEILFSMRTVFHISEITPMDENHRLFQVKLILTNDNDKDLRVLTDRIQKEIFPDDEGWFRLGLVLLKIGQSEIVYLEGENLSLMCISLAKSFAEIFFADWTSYR
jgi:hypothetical protein